MTPTRRRAVALVATVALLALAGWCLTRGIETRPSTGGLLTAPVPSTRLAGGWLLAAAVAGTAAILTALDAGAGLVAGRRGPRRAGGPTGGEHPGWETGGRDEHGSP